MFNNLFAPRLALETVPIDAGFEHYNDTPKICKSMFFYFLYRLIRAHTISPKGGNSAQPIQKFMWIKVLSVSKKALPLTILTWAEIYLGCATTVCSSLTALNLRC
jgi:hypothetical protein